MKTFKLLTFLLFATICSYGQTASWLDSRTVTNAEGQQSVSLGNPFLKAGVKLSMLLNAGADFSNNILFGVRFRKDYLFLVQHLLQLLVQILLLMY
jgi:hypothetical protein